MDTLTQQLSDFLQQIHLHPNSVSEKIKHYMNHLLYLLPDKELQLIYSFYGLFDSPQKSLSELVKSEKLSPEALHDRIALNLRKLAITPEWEMIKTII